MVIRCLTVILFLFFSGCVNVSEKQPNETNLKITKEVVASFGSNDFERIHSHFNEDMKKHLDVRGIKNMWNSVLIQVGNFRGSHNITAEAIGKMEVVWCDLEFDDTTAYLKLAFDDEHLIAGMFLLPTKH